MSNTFAPGPTPHTVRAADGKIVTVPEGWVQVPPVTLSSFNGLRPQASIRSWLRSGVKRSTHEGRRCGYRPQCAILPRRNVRRSPDPAAGSRC